MSLSRSEVSHVARLAFISLTPSELDLLTHQLAGIVDHLDTLGEVIGLGSAMPSATGDEELRLRDDVALPSWLPHQVVANASAHMDGLIEVQAVLD